MAAHESVRLCAQKYKEEEISLGCAICCFDSAESYRWSKIVLPVRKTITFRRLFLPELGLQLYLSLNNLRFPFSLFFVIFPSTALFLSCSQVAGIKGVFLSNKVVENQVKTYITYNKGRDWRLLRAPTTDLQGNKVYCEQVSGPLTRGRLDYLDFHYLLKIRCSESWSKTTNKSVSHAYSSEYVNSWSDLLNNSLCYFDIST